MGTAAAQTPASRGGQRARPAPGLVRSKEKYAQPVVDAHLVSGGQLSNPTCLMTMALTHWGLSEPLVEHNFS